MCAVTAGCGCASICSCCCYLLFTAMSLLLLSSKHAVVCAHASKQACSSHHAHTYTMFPVCTQSDTPVPGFCMHWLWQNARSWVSLGSRKRCSSLHCCWDEMLYRICQLTVVALPSAADNRSSHSMSSACWLKRQSRTPVTRTVRSTRGQWNQP